MSGDYQLSRRLPELRDPLLVTMLTGWIDASGAADSALTTLAAACSVEHLATFDGDVFVDYRARRPTMELRDGVNTRLVWPEITISTGTTEDGRDIVLLSGPEPDTQWRRFCSAVTELSVSLGVVRAIGFGAYPFSSPHTRPPRLSCTSPAAETFAGLPFLFSSLDIPAGAWAALEHSLHTAGIPALGMWVQVPHYVAAMPCSAAAVALLDALAQVTGVRLDYEALAATVPEQRAHFDELIAANPDHVQMVAQLEAAYDATIDAIPTAASELPDVADLAAEVEQYLRDQIE